MLQETRIINVLYSIPDEIKHFISINAFEIFFTLIIIPKLWSHYHQFHQHSIAAEQGLGNPHALFQKTQWFLIWQLTIFWNKRAEAN